MRAYDAFVACAGRRGRTQPGPGGQGLARIKTASVTTHPPASARGLGMLHAAPSRTVRDATALEELSRPCMQLSAMDLFRCAAA